MTFLDILWNNILPPISVIMTIGLSDALEFYISPKVHQYHNCPDIMRMDWKNYNGYHAFLSGVKCAWFLILPLCLFRHSLEIISALNIINILIPLCCYFTGIDKTDIYYSHKLLYLYNPLFLSMSIVFILLQA